MHIKFPKNPKIHPREWYRSKDKRGPGKRSRRFYKLNRLQRLMKFTWALRKIWGSKQLWGRLAMRPGLERYLNEKEAEASL